MTGAEFAFGVIGLLLGIAVGAALIEFLRARPPAPREVRVTVAQDAIPRRATTLADDAFVAAAPEPARGGPADRRMADDPRPLDLPDRRTPVPSVVGVLVSGDIDPMLQALRASAAASAVAAMRATGTTSVIARDDGMPPTGSAREPPSDRVTEGDTITSSAGAGGAGPPADQEAPMSDAAPLATGPCADARRLADERCELADRARSAATTAEDAHRAAQRAYDDHDALADEAAAVADPRAMRRAKDEAQARFRARRGGALTTEAIEEAARDWLVEINRINAEARDGAAILARERELVRTLTLDLERLAVEADAARIASEMAAAACLAAREALAACEEAAAGAVSGRPTAEPEERPLAGHDGDDAVPLAMALGRGGEPRIFRLVRGDRAAMAEIVLTRGGDDATERKRWQLLVSDLVDAILAESIAASSLAFPEEHPFWGPFTLEQDRDIVSALASLGYRFDGLGGWVDGRYPSQRDLSLALGYAGLDPMRIRHWPNDAEMADLYRDVIVAADEHLASAAGDLSLGELVTMLGRRADGLAEVWNHWGRLRPLLLEET